VAAVSTKIPPGFHQENIALPAVTGLMRTEEGFIAGGFPERQDTVLISDKPIQTFQYFKMDPNRNKLRLRSSYLIIRNGIIGTVSLDQEVQPIPKGDHAK
jgi:hypothetical protein